MGCSGYKSSQPVGGKVKNMIKYKNSHFRLIISIIMVVIAAISLYFSFSKTTVSDTPSLCLTINGFILGYLAYLGISSERKLTNKEIIRRLKIITTEGMPENVANALNEHVKTSTDFLENIYTNKCFTIFDGDKFKQLFKQVLHTYRGKHFCATSFPSKVFFWGDNTIIEAMKAFINDGGSLTRIFFLDSETELEKPEIQDILNVQLDLGIKVYITKEKHETEETYFMYEEQGEIGWETRLKKDNKVGSVEVTWNKSKIDEYKSRYNTISGFGDITLYSRN